MNTKKGDKHIRTLINNGVSRGHRTMFIVVGKKSSDQIIYLHDILAEFKSKTSILWCSANATKNITTCQNEEKDNEKDDRNNCLTNYLQTKKVRYCSYDNVNDILGNTYGMCVLEDFEALVPNILAKTIETIEGGGIIVFLLPNINSMTKLSKLPMKIHRMFNINQEKGLVSRFNERFVQSVNSCKNCLVIDDEMQILSSFPSYSKVDLPLNKLNSEEDIELMTLKESLQDTKQVYELLNCCKTMDQAKSLLKLIDAMSEKNMKCSVSLTGARGRGKSATLGLAIAGAIVFGYSNIFVSSPSPENLNTLFKFIFKGFDALNYEENVDYNLLQSTNSNKSLVRINIFKNHRQTIQYIHPSDASKLSQVELLVIDEAASIPLSYVKSMIGPYLMFFSTTVSGYEGCGYSLSSNLLQELKIAASETDGDKKDENISNRRLEELILEESIRYKSGDAVEKWLTDLLCLDTTKIPEVSGCPHTDICNLYYINRETLFSHHKVSEAFLQKIISLFSSSNYKNNPNDLQVLADAPNQHLFCLLGPVNPNKKALPEIFVALQVSLEGDISKEILINNLNEKQRTSSNLIPWLMTEQFNDNFSLMRGARIVRIATHPDHQSKGYGTRALDLLKKYYSLEMINFMDENEDAKEPDSLDENAESRPLMPLLQKLNERPPEKLNYIGVSFGLTEQLLKFWKCSDFIPVYVSENLNEITGERTCLMLYSLEENSNINWLETYWIEFRKRLVPLLMYFTELSAVLATNILSNNLPKTVMNKSQLDNHFTPDDLERLENYNSSHLDDYYSIRDVIPQLARLYFLNKLGDTSFLYFQEEILLGLGLQGKNVDELSGELARSWNNFNNLSLTQMLGLLQRVVRKAYNHLNSIAEDYVSSKMNVKDNVNTNIQVSMLNGKALHEELETADRELKIKQKAELEKLKQENLKQFRITGADEEIAKHCWNPTKSKSLISIIKENRRASLNDQDPNSTTKKTKKKIVDK